MSRTYADLSALVSQKLMDTGATVFAAGEINYQIEECLKELATYQPHIVEVIFQIESRHGTEEAGTANTLTDTLKAQFVATDDDNEKVIHNITDHTWAVVKTYTDESHLVLTADIMNANEQYEIYNKHCWNNHQIYIGDVIDYQDIDSVEYPIGTKRNWKLYDNVLEIMVDRVADSDSTLTSLPNVDVLVRFAKPHKLSQLTDWVGEIAATGGYTQGAVSIVIDGIGTSGTVEEGEEFYLENKRLPYTVGADATIGTVTTTLTFFPGLEDAASDNDDITFRKSTLQPNQEEILADLVAARVAINHSSKLVTEVELADSQLDTGAALINQVNKGGDVMGGYAQAAAGYLGVAGGFRYLQEWGERKLAEVLGKLRRGTPPKTKRVYSRE